jgi:hypothetical protein
MLPDIRQRLKQTSMTR